MNYSILKKLSGLSFKSSLLAYDILFYNVSYLNESALDFFQSHTFHEILIPLSNSLGVDIDGGIVTVRQGELLYIGPQTLRKLKIYPDIPIECILISFNVSENTNPSAAAHESWILDERQLFGRLFEHNVLICTDNGSVRGEIDRLCTVVEQNLTGFPSLLSNTLANLLVRILQCFSNCPTRRAPSLAGENKLTNKAIRINEYICQNFTHDITVQSVADALNYSSRHLQRIIMEYYSISFSDLLTQYRVALSKSLLGLTNDPIETIAEKCGFSSLKSFEKNFKERVGITPMTFRKIFGKVR